MPAPILATKLYIPPARANLVSRPRLTALLDDGLERPLTLVSAAAGFGKTTLVSAWLAGCERPAAWLSLDEGDNDPARFLGGLIAALQTVSPGAGLAAAGMLQSPQPAPPAAALTALINEIAALPDEFVLVLDDYHLIESQPVDQALGYLVEHLPRQMHVVIATREDPRLPLPRLRARGQLCEVRVADLRFTLAEAACFLTQVMGLDVTENDVAALEARTEGWIAGLQLAAISLQGQKDASGFIKSFTGSHHFVLDYLVEEVLLQQPERIQTFLLRTSILERLCGPLCEAVLGDGSTAGQETLEYIERNNLFVVPLDSERRWYRYHHLFRDLLRQRQRQAAGPPAEELHVRASQWFEENGLDIEAFQHAAAGRDVARAERLIEGRGMPLHFRGALAPVLNWLRSLPESEMNARPSLWSTYASVLLGSGQTVGIEEKMQAAEKALEKFPETAWTRDLTGRLASTRALLALSQQLPEQILAQGKRALEYLHPDNLPFRISINQTMAFAYALKGERAEAIRLYRQTLAAENVTGNLVTQIMASIGLGGCLLSENRLHEAAEIYQQLLKLAGDIPFPVISEAYRGLAQIYYQWNDLEAAGQHLEKARALARQLINTDRSVACEFVGAQLALARGDTPGAIDILTRAHQEVREHHYIYRIPEIAELLTAALLRLGELEAAETAAGEYGLPACRARVLIAKGLADQALPLLESMRREAESKAWADGRLKAAALQALALEALGDEDQAQDALAEALSLAEAGGFIRYFVDEGPVMEGLLKGLSARGVQTDYIGQILAAFEVRESPRLPSSQRPLDALSERELEVLRLVAEGLSNREIGECLFLALSTVKGHIQLIFNKLQVQRRTEAVARARELGLL